MKLKYLERKFTYNQLVKECEEQGWRLATKAELKGGNLPYPIYVSDQPDDDHYAIMYDGKEELLVPRSNFMMKTAVVKLKCSYTVTYDGVYFKCGARLRVHNTRENFKYCPFCGRELEK